MSNLGLSALVLVRFVGVGSIFIAVAVVSAIAGFSVLLVRPQDVGERDVAPRRASVQPSRLVAARALLRDRRVLVLLGATALFHLANAPVMPMVALYVKHLGGTDGQVAGVVLTAQAVMVPVALVAGWLGDAWGRKPLYAVAFVVLPLRILAYTLTHDPRVLVALQALDGIAAGIYGVVIVALCADLTRGKGHFNALVGIAGMANSLGAVLGPLVSGEIIQRLGFTVAFVVFAGVAAAGAVLWIAGMPETRARSPGKRPPRERAQSVAAMIPAARPSQ